MTAQIVIANTRGLALASDSASSRGGFSSKVPWLKLLRDEIMIRYDNGQNIFLILFLLFYKLSFKIIDTFKKIIQN